MFVRKILHYYMNVNNLTSIWIILSPLNTLNKNQIIYNLIFKADNEDESILLYLGCKLGKLEMFILCLFY